MKTKKNCLMITMIICLLVSLFVSTSVEASTKHGWVKDSKGWHYYYSDGSYAKCEFVSGYWFNKNGNITYSHKSSWKKNSKGWWYGDKTGWYAKDRWLKIDGVKYYFNSKGYMQIGWKTIGKNKYYFNSKGIYATGWKRIHGKNYYFGSNGAMKTGWVKISKKWYYFNSKGIMLVGWKTISNQKYYFNSKGIMLTNQWIGNKWVGANGVYDSTKVKHTCKYVAKVTTPSTCTENGIMTYTCSCGKSYTETIKATGHDWSDWTIIDTVTCTENGMEYRYCKTCGKKEYKTIYATGHTIVVDKAVAPTCTKTGKTEGKHCSVCGEIIVAQEEIEPLGHDFQDVVVKPTCTEDGYTTHKCTRCKAELEHTDIVSATGHHIIDEVIEPTCCEKGYTRHYCTNCTYEYKDTEVDALGHDLELVSYNKYDILNRTISEDIPITGYFISDAQLCQSEKGRDFVTRMKNHEYPTANTYYDINMFENIDVNNYNHDCNYCIFCIDGKKYTTIEEFEQDFDLFIGSSYVSRTIYYSPDDSTRTCSAKYECTRCHEIIDGEYTYITTPSNAVNICGTVYDIYGNLIRK